MTVCNVVPIPVIGNLILKEELDQKPIDATLYKQLVGSLRYICNSRPDISYGVDLVSRFMADLRAPHLFAAKHILTYLEGTIDLALFYPRKAKECDNVLEAWSDSDWCGYKVERKNVTSLAYHAQSMSGYYSPMHPNPSPFSVHSYWVGCCQWESNPQPDL